MNAPEQKYTHPLLAAEHIVAGCHWDTGFDDVEQADTLQTAISRWSSHTLPELLQQSFDKYCPAQQTWRIDHLALDLGNLPLDDLENHLTLRVQSALARELKRILAQQLWQPRLNQLAGISIEDNSHAPNDFIRSFLVSGTVPWWYQGNQSHAQILELQLLNAPQALAQIIRIEGKKSQVRQRMVWQWGEQKVRKIVVILEPYHHDYILSFADQLFDFQARNNIAKSDSASFRQHGWLWILTHLLVERGTLFNTVDFVRSTLKHMAAQYQIEYLLLLDTLVSIAQMLEHTGRPVPVFIQAIHTIYQQAVSAAPEPKVVDEADYWHLFDNALSHCQSQVEVAGQRIGLAELLAELAFRSPEKMTLSIKHHGRKAQVRKHLSGLLDHSKLAIIVKLVSPKEHQFIVAHVEQTSSALVPGKQGLSLVWQVILAYLLLDSGSCFNRRQFVHQTLVQIGQKHGIAYGVLLDMMCGRAAMMTASQPGGHYRFELLGIFNELQKEAAAKNAADTGYHSHQHLYFRALQRYLNGDDNDLETALQLPQNTVMLSQAINLQSHWLQQLFNGPSFKAEKLTKLVNLLSPTDFGVLVHTLDASAGRFVEHWLAQLQSWQQKQWLSALSGVDMDCQLLEIVLQVMFELREHGFSVARFTAKTSDILVREYGVDRALWLQNLNDCLAQNSPKGPFDSALLQWLNNQTVEVAAKKPGDSGPLERWSVKHKLNVLFDYLRGNEDALIPYSLNQVFGSLVPEHAEQLLLTLRNQQDRQQLVHALLRDIQTPKVQWWFASLCPKTNSKAQQLLQQWQQCISETRLWQGSTALLKQKLSHVFWLCVLDSSFTVHGLEVGANAHVSQSTALLLSVIKVSCAHLHINMHLCVEQITRQQSIEQGSDWHGALQTLTGKVANQSPQPVELQTFPPIKGEKPQPLSSHFVQDDNGHYLNHPMFEQVFVSMLTLGRVPLSFYCDSQFAQTQVNLSLKQMLNDLMAHQPQRLKWLLQQIYRVHKSHVTQVEFRLCHLIHAQLLLKAAIASDGKYQAQLEMLDGFYNGLQQLKFNSLDHGVLSKLFLQEVLSCWLSGQWQRLSSAEVVRHFSWLLYSRHGIEVPLITRQFALNKAHFPEQLVLEAPASAVNDVDSTLAQSPLQTLIKPASQISQNKQSQLTTTQARLVEQGTLFKVSNAGIVLLQGYYKMLFERLGLVADKAFVNDSAQRRSVHILQYLVNGLCDSEEHQLVLNKILCGLDVSWPIESGFAFSPSEKTLCDGLIEAMNNNWSNNGTNSVDGFRGNWLIRDGSLKRGEEGWELVIEKRPYDLLLKSAPFSYSIIKLPWMAQPLYVTWPT